MPTWTGEVVYLPTGEAVRPGNVLVEPGDVPDAQALIGWSPVSDEEDGPDRLVMLEGDPGDAPGEHVFEQLVALRAAGIWAQPNHVLFATCTSASLMDLAPLHASAGGVYAAPLHASTLMSAAGCCCCPSHPSIGAPSGTISSKVMASPLHASPLHASSYVLTGERPSTALPAAEPDEWLPRGASDVVVAIIDTGLPEVALRPPALASDAQDGLGDAPDSDGDGVLDPVAGHGMFIAGVVTQAAPDAGLRHISLVEPSGEVSERALAIRVRELCLDDARPAVLNLSLAGYAFEDMRDLASAIRSLQALGTIVVASAGNDATCRPTYPAVLPGVIGVGAVDGAGRPAPFSNYGPWVRAAAFGVDVVSWFFVQWHGDWRPDGILPADVENVRDGWARWSGTSFAAPWVAGRIAKRLIDVGPSPDPVAAVLGASGRHMPWLGAVVE